MKITEPNILAFLATLSFFGIVGLVFAPPAPIVPSHQQTAAAIEAVTPSLFVFTPEPHIVADAAYVYDIATQTTLFGHEGIVQLPLASLTKIALVVLAGEYLNLQGEVLITKRSLLPEGEWGLVAGDRWNTKDLVDYTLMVSSNDGAAALAEAIENASGSDIVTLLNDLSHDLGLAQTYFLNETGLDTSTQSGGAYGSAQDMAMLLAYAYKTAAPLFEATEHSYATFTSAEGLVYEATNTNQALGKLPGIVFGKTGFTDLAGGNLAIVAEVEPGHPVVVVVLGSTLTERFSDVTTLLSTIHTQQVAQLQN